MVENPGPLGHSCLNSSVGGRGGLGGFGWLWGFLGVFGGFWGFLGVLGEKWGFWGEADFQLIIIIPMETKMELFLAVLW